MDRALLAKLAKLAQTAVETFRSRYVLTEGCGAGDWRHRELCEEVERWRRDPGWSILARAV